MVEREATVDGDDLRGIGGDGDRLGAVQMAPAWLRVASRTMSKPSKHEANPAPVLNEESTPKTSISRITISPPIYTTQPSPRRP